MPELANLMTPLGLAVEATGGKYKRAPHLELLQREFFAVLYGDWDVLVAMAPPRHGKSEFLSRWVNTWYLSTYVDRRCILASYALDLARTHSRFVRDSVHEFAPWYGAKGVKKSAQAVTDWMTEGGGGLLAAGVGGGITGRAAHLFTIDDPLKNAEQAISEKIRDSQWEWWQTTAFTRLEPGAKMVLLATRWHEEDLLGRVLKHVVEDVGLRVRQVRLPALSEGLTDVLGRPEGEPLWPERYDREALLRFKNTLDPYWWDALFQQRLGQYGKNEWPPEYFYGIIAQDDEWPERCALSAVALDPSKGKNARKGDYSAIVYAGFKDGYIWVDADIERRPVPQMIEDLIQFNLQYRPTVTGIESVAFQELLAESYILAQQQYNYYDQPELIDNSVSKEYRIRRLGFWLRLHRIKIRNTPGGQLLLRQMKEFPNGSHDDGCFAAGTLVETNRGSVPIECVTVGDMVATRSGYSRVLASGCTGVRSVRRYVFEDGRHLIATPDHPVYDGHSFTPIRKRWSVYACQEFIHPLSQLPLCLTGSYLGDIQRLSSGRIGCIIARMLGIGETELVHCTKRFGSRLMGQFLKGCRFTTLTTILSTMRSRIWNAYRRRSMTPFIQMSGLQGLSCQIVPERQQLHGIDQSVVGPGIPSMQRKLRQIEILSLSPVLAAESVIRPRLHQGQSSVQLDAGKGFMQLKELRVVSELTQEKQPVYNLTTESGEYLANGILVHNCDALEMTIRLLLQISESLQEIGKYADYQTLLTI